MFSIQRNLLRPTEVCTRQDFFGCFGDKRVDEKISEIRRLTKTVLDPSAPAEVKKQAERKRQSLKKSLPGMLFQATFEETASKRGVRGRWRKQGAAVLNGLYMCDIDHVDNPRQTFDQWGGDKAMAKLGVMLCYITPSGHGLKLVAKANCDGPTGNIIDNARWLAAMLGVETDEACKDASRLSFVSTTKDILYINEEIFDYENKDFESQYGDTYRNGGSSGNLFGNGAATAGADDGNRTESGCRMDGRQADGNGDGSGGQGGEDWDVRNVKNLERNGQGEICFGGTSYKKIVEEYARIRGGEPHRGSRHAWLLSMAKQFRYICDFDRRLLLHVLTLSKAGAEVKEERGTRELQDIVNSNLLQPAYNGYPKHIRMACEGCGVKLPATKAGTPVEQVAVDYQYWHKRLEPLLDGGYKEAVDDIDDMNKLGGVLSAGAMFGTYLTKCWWYHYDGNPYRLSYMVYVIGDPASGKSFVIRQDQEIMKLLRDQDAAGRKWEAKVKEENEKRMHSTKEAKKEAMVNIHPVIRYVPSSISNAVFYRRSMDAKTQVGGQEMHLHLYTMESELATALRSQVGSWAGKHDLELKSFQNEFAGVDFANAQSTNGIIQVNWNQVTTTTLDGLHKKLMQGDINDGFITRLALWVMPTNNYVMIQKQPKRKAMTQQSPLQRWGSILEQIEGEIEVPQLVDFCYDWCAKQCEYASIEDDQLIDYFRKRIPLYMMRYTIPRIVMREYQNHQSTGKWTVEKSDLEFAQLIGDYLMYIQIYLFGAKIEAAKDKTLEEVKPRLRKSAFASFYANLATVFTRNEFFSYYANENSARTMLSRLIRKNIVEKLEEEKYRKLIDDLNDIPVK